VFANGTASDAIIRMRNPLPSSDFVATIGVMSTLAGVPGSLTPVPFFADLGVGARRALTGSTTGAGSACAGVSLAAFATVSASTTVLSVANDDRLSCASCGSCGAAGAGAVALGPNDASAAAASRIASFMRSGRGGVLSGALLVTLCAAVSCAGVSARGVIAAVVATLSCVGTVALFFADFTRRGAFAAGAAGAFFGVVDFGVVDFADARRARGFGVDSMFST